MAHAVLQSLDSGSITIGHRHCIHHPAHSDSFRTD